MEDKPLQGLKIADFSYIIAGPIISQTLAYYGAQVVAVENPYAMTLHTYLPFAGGIPGPNRSAAYLHLNASKYSMILNLQKPGGVDVAKRLVSWADVVIEQFTPGVMERIGLNYDELKKIKQDIIMLSISGQGQTGPYANLPSFGNYIVALSGLYSITRYEPDGAPQGPWFPYLDYVCGFQGLSVVLAALDYRRRTGKGQHIDLSMLEVSSHLMAPFILDYTANNQESLSSWCGNHLDRAAPHSIYRCKGEDSWCAIGIFSDDEWRTFCQAIGNPDWSWSPEYATFLGRKQNENKLNKLVESFTLSYTAEEIMTMLQKAGINAGVVQDVKGLYEDRHLWDRGFLKMQPHTEAGDWAWAASPFRLSEISEDPRQTLIGQDIEYVCTELLGIPDDEFAQLMNDGTFNK